MRLGGWWRLWISLSALWVAGALAINLADRPTPDRVARNVARTCGIETPLTEQYARDALQMRNLLDELVTADAAKDEASAKRLAGEIERLRHQWARNTHVPIKYQLVKDHDNTQTTVALLPASKDEAEGYYEGANNWASLSKYCVEELESHATGDLRRTRTADWVFAVLAGVMSFPLVSLALGWLLGWVWRGFRPKSLT